MGNGSKCNNILQTILITKTTIKSVYVYAHLDGVIASVVLSGVLAGLALSL